MHDPIFFLAVAWATGLLFACAVAAARLSTTAARILALDVLTLVIVALLVIYSAAERSPYYIDAALILALLAFMATLIAARYYGGRKVL